MIKVVGLGKEKGDLTDKGKKAIKCAEKVFCRTFLTPASRFLKKSGAESFDLLFNESADFNELNDKIVSVLKLSEKEKNIAYCVGGDGYSDEAVKLLFESGENLEIIAGVSDMGAREPSGGINIFSAYELTAGQPQIDTNFCLSIKEIDNPILAGEVKLYLLLFYPPQIQVGFSINNKEKKIELQELDRMKKYNFSSSVFINAQNSFDKKRYCFSDLLKIMKRLTAADGCEWDKAQTHESIRINMIEEAYEAVDAIDSGDINAMIEETGDVILQSVFHSDIALRAGEYDFYDVIDALCKKLVSRHTHIFGENKASDSAQALGFWEKAKEKEKKHNSLSDELNSIPDIFPSTLKTEKAVKKAVKAGIKINEQSLKQALISAIETGSFEKALFLCVAVLTLNKKDAEVELNLLCRKFIGLCANVKEIDKINITEMI